MIDEADYARFLVRRREEILERIGAAAARAGRDAGEVGAIAVSKTVSEREVLLARRAGWDAFGENRPQELVRKTEALSGEPEMAGVRFDMIGNLQKNKINQVLGRADLIHSISSSHLAEAVSTRSAARSLVSDVLLEVNVSGEASKSGFAPAGAARRTFCGLRELAEELRVRTGRSLEVLSCGMSDDFEFAVEEGSTLVRLGRCVFDQGYALR